MQPAVPDLLDTSVLLHLVRQDALARWALTEFGLLRPENQPVVSILSVGEIRALALRLGWGAGKQFRLENLLLRVRAVPLDFPA